MWNKPTSGSPSKTNPCWITANVEWIRGQIDLYLLWSILQRSFEWPMVVDRLKARSLSLSFSKSVRIAAGHVHCTFRGSRVTRIAVMRSKHDRSGLLCDTANLHANFLAARLNGPSCRRVSSKLNIARAVSFASWISARPCSPFDSFRTDVCQIPVAVFPSP